MYNTEVMRKKEGHQHILSEYRDEVEQLRLEK